jgi:hypothetical protein
LLGVLNGKRDLCSVTRGLRHCRVLGRDAGDGGRQLFGRC